MGTQKGDLTFVKHSILVWRMDESTSVFVYFLIQIPGAQKGDLTRDGHALRFAN